MHGTRGDAELGDDPQRARLKLGSNARAKSVELRLREAVEEEVGDDEVVAALGREGERAGLVSAETSAGILRLCYSSSLQQTQHGAAGVDRIRVQIGIDGEQTGEEAAVAISEDERPAASLKLGQKTLAAAFERPAKGRVLHPAIEGRDAIEVRGALVAPHRRKGSPGDLAPDFDLETLDKSARVRLSSFRARKPVVLIFGSYT